MAPTPAVAPPVLGGGLWLWYWLAARAVSPAQVVDDCAAVGAVGVLIHEVGTATPQLRWLDRAGTALGSLGTCVAIGSRGPSKWDTAQAVPAIAALNAGRRVMLDDESAWDTKATSHPAARRMVDKIRDRVPNAVGRVADCAWWKPDVHRGFPLAILGELCASRYPQCYAEVRSNGRQRDGACADQLAHADAVYPTMGRSHADVVFPTVRGYVRSARDAAKLALDVPHQLVYLGSHRDAPNAMSAEVRKGLVAAKRVRDAGGVVKWQAAHGLTVDGIVGPRSLASMGL